MSLAQVAPEAVVRSADYISRQSDRWLFIALLIVFLLAIAALTKWGMRQLDKRDAKIDSLGAELAEVRKDFTDAQIEQTKELVGVVAANTAAMNHNSDVFGRFKHYLEVVAPVPPLKGTTLPRNLNPNDPHA